MKYTQNKKIEQVKETTMIVGIDVGSEKHYFKSFLTGGHQTPESLWRFQTLWRIQQFLQYDCGTDAEK